MLKNHNEQAKQQPAVIEKQFKRKRKRAADKSKKGIKGERSNKRRK
jgi:hypothetical protein